MGFVLVAFLLFIMEDLEELNIEKLIFTVDSNSYFSVLPSATADK